jgi:glycosyltransferase involved in cell wall biosynthesis
MRVIIDVSRALAEAGFATQLVVPDYASEIPFPLHPTSRVLVVPTAGGSSRFRWMSWLAAHAADDCDIVVATTYRSPWYIHASLLRSRRSRTPVVFMMQSDEVLSQVDLVPGRPIYKALMRPLAVGCYRLPTEKVAVSQSVADRVGHPGARVIANGVDPVNFYPPALPRPVRKPGAGPPFVIGAIARPGGAKGFNELMATCIRVKESLGDQVQFLFAAPASVSTEVLPELLKNTLFVQPANDEQMRSFYHRLDVFLFTSPCEGFGLPPLEAMACGIPVVSTRCGGNAEYATDSNCALADAGDVRALASSCEALARHPEQRMQLREQGLATAARFSVSRQCEQWVDFFTDVARRTQGPTSC